MSAPEAPGLGVHSVYPLHIATRPFIPLIQNILESYIAHFSPPSINKSNTFGGGKHENKMRVFSFAIFQKRAKIKAGSLRKNL